MNVFVVGTGRCGTTTFSEACKFATNFTVAHESNAGRPYDFDYPPDHIEVDAPLAFWMPTLRLKYPGCKFVHLWRQREECVRSMVKNDPEITRWFARMLYHWPEATPEEGAAALYDVINNVATGADVFHLRLKYAADRWREVWDWLGLSGDFDRSREEWSVKHNATDRRD